MLEMTNTARRMTALPAPNVAAPSNAPRGITIRTLPPEARFSLRLDETVAKAVGRVADFALDIPLNTWDASGARSALRLGPNEWLLIAPEGDAEVVPEQFGATLSEHFYALTDIGHRNVAIEVSGPHASDVLSSGCPLDLMNTAFPTGTATRTLMGKAEIVLMQLDDAPTYRVECWRSFAQYVYDFLTEAAREFA